MVAGITCEITLVTISPERIPITIRRIAVITRGTSRSTGASALVP